MSEQSKSKVLYYYIQLHWVQTHKLSHIQPILFNYNLTIWQFDNLTILNNSVTSYFRRHPIKPTTGHSRIRINKLNIDNYIIYSPFNVIFTIHYYCTSWYKYILALPLCDCYYSNHNNTQILNTISRWCGWLAPR